MRPRHGERRGKRLESRSAEREGRAARIAQLASQRGLQLQDDLQVVAGAELQQAWRWELRPKGQREQLVVFRHGRADEQGQLEVRAAVLKSAPRARSCVC